jgi:hypothetical protein
VALDVFLWLGPRLKADTFLAPLKEILPQLQSQATNDQAREMVTAISEFANNFNLFSAFRTFPLGIFSLMTAKMSVASPLGGRTGIDVPHWLIAVGLILILTFLGWLGGSLYFGAVSRVALKLEKGPGIFRSTLHSVLLSGVWLVLFNFISLPLLVMLWLVALFNSLIQTLAIFLMLFPITWLMLMAFFSFHGIFAGAQNAFDAVRSSFRLMRYGLPPLGWFAMLALLINQGMNLLWNIPPADSWMLGIGILGHAFVSTSLLAASFIYFRDLNAWIESALQWLKAQKTTSSARA